MSYGSPKNLFSASFCLFSINSRSWWFGVFFYFTVKSHGYIIHTCQESFYCFVHLQHTACSWNSLCINSAMEHVGVFFLLIQLVCILCIYSTHPTRTWSDTIFKRSRACLNFYPRLVAQPRLRNPACPTIYLYLGRIDIFMSLSRALVRIETQTTTSRIPFSMKITVTLSAPPDKVCISYL